MSFTTILGLGQTALELGLMSSLTVLALFLSYTMLNVCDLSTDGCFTLGAAGGAVVALAGQPFLSIPAAMLAGMLSGGLMVFVWKYIISPLGGVFGIYELLPAFLMSLLVCVVVSLITPAPSAEIEAEFDAAK